MGKGDKQPPLRRPRDSSSPRRRARARTTSPPAVPPSPLSPAISSGSSSSTTNEEEQEAVQQQIFLQNGNLVNLMESMARNALMQRNEQIAHLRLQLQKTKEALQAAKQWKDLVTKRYEITQMLISQLPPMQGTNAQGHGLTYELESTGSCNQAKNMKGTAEKSKYLTTLTCEVCCSRLACMLILPCRHLCACKSCGDNLTVCPVCGSAKVNMIEAKFGRRNNNQKPGASED